MYLESSIVGKCSTAVSKYSTADHMRQQLQILKTAFTMLFVCFTTKPVLHIQTLTTVWWLKIGMVQVCQWMPFLKLQYVLKTL